MTYENIKHIETNYSSLTCTKFCAFLRANNSRFFFVYKLIQKIKPKFSNTSTLIRKLKTGEDNNKPEPVHAYMYANMYVCICD